MQEEDTVKTLFNLAIRAERTAQKFYLGLAKEFSHLAEVSEFWRGMSKDEVQHAKELENICGSVTREQLIDPADPSMLKQLMTTFELSAEDILKSVKNLEDAYQLAHELENSEVNNVFKFLAMKFISSDKRLKFVMSEMNVHLTKIMDFSQTFGNAEWRKSIVVDSS